MKAVELPAYRAFMFSAVVELLPHYGYDVAEAIRGARAVWEAVEGHILAVAEEVEEGGAD